MLSGTKLSRHMWLLVCGVAILVTAIGGTWRVATSLPPSWKTDIQMPGVLVVMYAGWAIGPFSALLTPTMTCVLTILVNVLVYSLVLKLMLAVVRKVKRDT